MVEFENDMYGMHVCFSRVMDMYNSRSKEAFAN